MTGRLVFSRQQRLFRIREFSYEHFKTVYRLLFIVNFAPIANNYGV